MEFEHKVAVLEVNSFPHCVSYLISLVSAIHYRYPGCFRLNVHHCTKNYRKWKLVIAVLRKSLLKMLIKLFRLIFYSKQIIPFPITSKKERNTVDSKRRGKNGKCFDTYQETRSAITVWVTNCGEVDSTS